MPEFVLRHVPVISESVTTVIYHEEKRWLRIGMMVFPYEEVFDYAVKIVKDDPGRLLPLPDEKYCKGCKAQTIQALIVLCGQVAIRHARQKLEEDSAIWHTLLFGEKLLLTQEAIRTAERRVEARFELCGITAPTLLSQGGEEIDLFSLLDPGETLVKRTVEEEVDSGASPTPFGQMGKELRRLASGSTLPARIYRIIPQHQAVPAGFEQVERVWNLVIEE